MKNQIVIFKTDDDKISVDVRFDEETVWLNLDQMATLFERDKSTISRHIKNVYDEDELLQNLQRFKPRAQGRLSAKLTTTTLM